MSVTLKSSTSFKILCCSLQFSRRICSYDHKLKLELCKIEQNLITPYPLHAVLMMLTKYLFNFSVWLTEQSVTVRSVTLRFYCSVLKRKKLNFLDCILYHVCLRRRCSTSCDRTLYQTCHSRYSCGGFFPSRSFRLAAIAFLA